ncbi:MAG: MBL fold metallo-hydrolase [Clostridia bacterium]|nr:MBL fold metallo-hydrolase [Clostridia bacterium]
MRITVLSENTVRKKGLLAEHGFSLWVEIGERKILFDTGVGKVISNNAAVLGFDLAEAPTVVLSHGHYDHTGGLPEVCDRATGMLTVYAHPAAFMPKYSRHPDGMHDIAMPSAAKNQPKQDADRNHHQKSQTEIVKPVVLIQPLRPNGKQGRPAFYAQTGRVQRRVQIHGVIAKAGVDAGNSRAECANRIPHNPNRHNSGQRQRRGAPKAPCPRHAAQRVDQHHPAHHRHEIGMNADRRAAQGDVFPRHPAVALLTASQQEVQRKQNQKVGSQRAVAEGPFHQHRGKHEGKQREAGRQHPSDKQPDQQRRRHPLQRKAKQNIPAKKLERLRQDRRKQL